MKFLSIILSCLSLVWLSQIGLTQQTDGLHNQKEMISDHIRLLNVSLHESQNKKNTLLEQYHILKSSISQRESLSGMMTAEIYALDSLILHIEEQDSTVGNDENWGKSELYKLIRRDLYRQLLPLSDDTILSNEAIVGDIIDSRYQSYIQNKVLCDRDNTSVQIQSLSDSISMLEMIRDQKEKLLLSEKDHIKRLRANVSTKKNLMRIMEIEESRLKTEINRQQNAQREINQQIKGSIEHAIYLDSLSHNNIGTSGFHIMQGRLDWPVSEGVVSKPFGELDTEYPSDLRYKNNGIDMICPAGAAVKAVYTGRVILSAVRPPYGHVVIINHGDYTTAYFYINESNVEIDQTLRRGDVIGYLNKDSSGVPFHFEIWHDQKQLDPQQWLRNR